MCVDYMETVYGADVLLILMYPLYDMMYEDYIITHTFAHVPIG